MDALRLAVFLGGLVALLGFEVVAPDHAPTAPRPRRWVANLGFAAINAGVTSAVCALCFAIAARGALPWRVGPFEALELPTALRIPGEVLVLDLLVYGLHRLYHRAPLLWRFHRVHHTDLDLDVTSASRFHLGEVAVSAAAKLALVVALGISPLGLVCFEMLLGLAAQFQHANLRIAPVVERLLWWTFVPPAMHRVHHRPDPGDTNSNYGTLVSWWDRLFGSLRREAVERERFGLEEWRDPGALGLPALLALPLRG